MSYQQTKRGFYHDTISQHPKFSHKDWSYNNQLKSRMSCDQQKLADRVICEASRVIDETKETTSKFKKETDYRLEERVAHIAFSVDELREQKRSGEREQEILKVLPWVHPSSLTNLIGSVLGHKKSNSMCHREHQNGRPYNRWKVHHIAWKPHWHRSVIKNILRWSLTRIFCR